MNRFYKKRQSLCKTSTGVGHAYAHALPFHTDSSKNMLLPPLLLQKAQGSGAPHYTCTSSTEHDRKSTNRLLSSVVYSKASSHWCTHFLNELTQKLQDSKSVKVVSEPRSEMQDRYKAQSAPQEPFVGHYKTLLGLHGQLDSAPALSLLPKEPLLSTAQADYRYFCRDWHSTTRGQCSSRSVSSPPSALEAPPIKGTLTRSGALSHLPTYKAPPNMSVQLHLPRSSVPLPHGGRTSQYMDSFTVPNPPPTFSTPAPAPNWAKCREADGKDLLQHILEVPKMYITENQNYGNRKMVLV